MAGAGALGPAQSPAEGLECKGDWGSAFRKGEQMPGSGWAPAYPPPQPGPEQGVGEAVALGTGSGGSGDTRGNPQLSGPSPISSKAAVSAVQAMNRICMLDVDLQGVRNIKKTDLQPIYIFVQPPSLDVLVGAGSLGLGQGGARRGGAAL